MATALASALIGCPVRRDVAMTGEITLRGHVLPIGGLKEKLLAAHRAGIKTVLIPKENVRDLELLPEHVRKEMEIVPVESMDEVLDRALVRVPPKRAAAPKAPTREAAEPAELEAQPRILQRRVGAPERARRRSMRVLVTGGAGFIGSNLVHALVGAGHDAGVVDDLSTGTADEPAPGRLVPPARHPRPRAAPTRSPSSRPRRSCTSPRSRRVSASLARSRSATTR